MNHCYDGAPIKKSVAGLPKLPHLSAGSGHNVGRGGAMTLQGKNALVTGSSRGIGRGIAFRLAENGARVAIHYVQNEAAAKKTLAEVCKRGGGGFIVQADVTKPDEIKAMFKKVAEQFGTLDIFVSSARPEAAAF